MSLLIIADDFSGALDTGVCFCSVGVNVKVVTAGYKICWMDEPESVLVVDAETRIMNCENAYDTVYQIAKDAYENGVVCIYKKTDSALRGNIGSELSALLAASGSNVLSFLPAYPEMNRITEKGTHYIEGKPLSDSEFNNDPYNSVNYSYIPDIIHQQCDTLVCVIPRNSVSQKIGEKHINVYDASIVSDMQRIAKRLRYSGELRAVAGCSGFASVLANLMEKKQKNCSFKIRDFDKLVVICGSVNPVSVRQIEYAELQGVKRFTLGPEQTLNPDFCANEEGQLFIKNMIRDTEKDMFFIVDTNDKTAEVTAKEYAKKIGISNNEVRKQIPRVLGGIASRLMEHGNILFMVVGGDTLMGFLEELSINEVFPLQELLPGTVLSEFGFTEKKHQIISKSGGFGEETLLMEVEKIVTERS